VILDRSWTRGRRGRAAIFGLLFAVFVSPFPAAAAEPHDPSPGSVAAALVEPAYLVGDWDLRQVRWKHLLYAGGPAPPTLTRLPRDTEGLPIRGLDEDGAGIYNPAVLAEVGMRYLHGYRKTGMWIYRRRANDIADKLDEIARIRGKRWQPHKYDRSGLTKGWVNANSHGLVMSFFSRYHLLTGREAMLTTAASLLPAFANRPVDARWFTMVTRKGNLWFEHWPDGRKKHVLNAHLNMLLGLYEYWRESDSAEAERLLQGGLRTVREEFYRFRRVGKLSQVFAQLELGQRALPQHPHRADASPGPRHRR
jgi:hypothetical protein